MSTTRHGLSRRSKPQVRCKECKLFASLVQRRATKMAKGVIWDIQQIRHNTGCAACCTLAAVFFTGDHIHGSNLIGKVSFQDGWTVSLRWRDDVDFSIVENPYFQVTRESFSHPLVHVGRYPHCSRGIGMSVPDHHIDILKVRQWISTCDHQHVKTCPTSANLRRPQDLATGMLLIDVHQKCLKSIPPEHNSQYVALSYVWGEDPHPFQTTRANVSALSSPGAFSRDENLVRLPKTILDSIELVMALGLQFLWVDRFCIVQDDAESKHDQIAAMAFIYGNAYLTVAATEGTAHTGLPGSQPQSPRRKPYREYRFGPNCQMLDRNPVFADIGGEMRAYWSRGWTYQEWTLSPRLLVFHDQTVSWYCQRGIQQENGMDTLRQVVPRTKCDPSKLRINWPDIETYLIHVREYSSRVLTYPEDVLAAFKAFMVNHGRSMKGHMLYGMPELFFTSLLLWTPSHKKLVRRNCVEKTYSERMPSWSWAGWIGEIDVKLAYGSCTSIYRPSGCAWAPALTHFHMIKIYMRYRVSDVRRRIKDLHYWSTRFPNAPGDFPDGHKFACFVPQARATTSLSTGSQISPLIEFRADRFFSRVVANDLAGNMIEWTEALQPFLIGKDDAIIGILDMSNYVFCDELVSNRDQFDWLELICLGGMEAEWTEGSRNFTGGSYFHRNCPAYCEKEAVSCSLGPDWRYRWYNVLWVERQDGVAYRKGIGKVWAVHWEAQEPEEVDVILG